MYSWSAKWLFEHIQWRQARFNFSISSHALFLKTTHLTAHIKTDKMYFFFKLIFFAVIGIDVSRWDNFLFAFSIGASWCKSHDKFCGNKFQHLSHRFFLFYNAQSWLRTGCIRLPCFFEKKLKLNFSFTLFRFYTKLPVQSLFAIVPFTKRSYNFCAVSIEKTFIYYNFG